MVSKSESALGLFGVFAKKFYITELSANIILKTIGKKNYI